MAIFNKEEVKKFFVEPYVDIFDFFCKERITCSVEYVVIPYPGLHSGIVSACHRGDWSYGS
jgi:hypothetical protein